ncbi:MAG: DUF6492 family protein [Simkaniaceae bacterium]|nr:DUF6492 family protein [Simkaniaceae bacterium]
MKYILLLFTLLFATEIDVIIPTTSKDSVTLNHCIKGIRENGIGVRNIYIVSPEKLTDQAEWIPESRYPFSKQDLAELVDLSPRHYRLGWYLQQLLKLYCFRAIENLSEYVLILDSDTIFLKPTHFVENGKMLINPSSEHYPPYFEHMKRLLPPLHRVTDQSGICNCMVFKKTIVEDLFWRVENFHRTEFWKAFMRCVERQHLRLSGASEYEILFNFYQLYYPEEIEVRPLNWGASGELSDLSGFAKSGLHYVSFHDYLRKRARRKRPQR